MNRLLRTLLLLIKAVGILVSLRVIYLGFGDAEAVVRGFPQRDYYRELVGSVLPAMAMLALFLVLPPQLGIMPRVSGLPAPSVGRQWLGFFMSLCLFLIFMAAIIAYLDPPGRGGMSGIAAFLALDAAGFPWSIGVMAAMGNSGDAAAMKASLWCVAANAFIVLYVRGRLLNNDLLGYGAARLWKAIRALPDGLGALARASAPQESLSPAKNHINLHRATWIGLTVCAVGALPLPLVGALGRADMFDAAARFQAISFNVGIVIAIFGLALTLLSAVSKISRDKNGK